MSGDASLPARQTWNAGSPGMTSSAEKKMKQTVRRSLPSPPDQRPAPVPDA